MSVGTDIRKLVTVETVAGISSIPDADAIEVAKVRGWEVVVKKDEFQVGDQVVYFEVDAALPLSDSRFAFLAPRGEKTLPDGSKVHVLKTARLRGQYSQGLVLPHADFPEAGFATPLEDALGVVKYEPPIPANLAGDAVGPFPTDLVPKTDAERVENLTDVFEKLKASGSWQATEKIDGSSVTYVITGDPDRPVRVCSRNWELIPTDRLTSMQLAERYNLADLPAGLIIQGEVYGEGIQSNPLRVKGAHLAVFNVFQGRNLLDRDAWPDVLKDHGAPVLDLELPETVEAVVEQADGLKSVIAPQRNAEGIVWHEKTGRTFMELEARACFKAISRKYLLKQA